MPSPGSFRSICTNSKTQELKLRLLKYLEKRFLDVYPQS
jgi:hypothetical protein